MSLIGNTCPHRPPSLNVRAQRLANRVLLTNVRCTRTPSDAIGLERAPDRVRAAGSACTARSSAANTASGNTAKAASSGITAIST